MSLKSNCVLISEKNVLYCNREETGEFTPRIILGAENPTLLGGMGHSLVGNIGIRTNILLQNGIL